MAVEHALTLASPGAASTPVTASGQLARAKPWARRRARPVSMYRVEPGPSGAPLTGAALRGRSVGHPRGGHEVREHDDERIKRSTQARTPPVPGRDLRAPPRDRARTGRRRGAAGRRSAPVRPRRRRRHGVADHRRRRARRRFLAGR